MAVNFARIGQDEAQLLDQVQNYPEKMAAVTVLTPNIAKNGKKCKKMAILTPNIAGTGQPARSC